MITSIVSYKNVQFTILDCVLNAGIFITTFSVVWIVCGLFLCLLRKKGKAETQIYKVAKKIYRFSDELTYDGVNLSIALFVSNIFFLIKFGVCNVACIVLLLYLSFIRNFSYSDVDMYPDKEYMKCRVRNVYVPIFTAFLTAILFVCTKSYIGYI